MVAAVEVASWAEPSVDRLLAAGDYVFRVWCRVMYVLIAVLVGYGFAFDELFYSRRNIGSDVFLALLGALLIAVVVQVTVVRVRLGFLVRFGEGVPPKRALPKWYDFWFAVAVAVFAVPVLLFGVYLSMP